MLASFLLDTCLKAGIDFFTGVPDSLLKGLCNELYARYGTDTDTHVVAHNEGGAIALCAGHYLASGRPGLCYMQNSGLGNAVNPLSSLMDPDVYAMPCLLVIGWRGEPGVKDEPQHVKQGRITLGQLDLLDIPYRIISSDTTEESFLADFEALMSDSTVLFPLSSTFRLKMHNSLLSHLMSKLDKSISIIIYIFMKVAFRLFISIISVILQLPI